MKLILSGFLIFFVFGDVYAFNWDKCRKREGGSSSMTRIMSSSSTSAVQWTSSWGDCSMIGSNPKDEVKVFFAKNYTVIKKESSKGEGEYLDSLIKLADCDSKTVLTLRSRIQKKFQEIYPVEKKSREKAFENISKMIRQDKDLSCRYLGFSKRRSVAEVTGSYIEKRKKLITPKWLK